VFELLSLKLVANISCAKSARRKYFPQRLRRLAMVSRIALFVRVLMVLDASLCCVNAGETWTMDVIKNERLGETANDNVRLGGRRDADCG
jgi:hypothetical protein